MNVHQFNSPPEAVGSFGSATGSVVPVTPTPEPSSIALLASGLGGLGCFRGDLGCLSGEHKRRSSSILEVNVGLGGAHSIYVTGAPRLPRTCRPFPVPVSKRFRLKHLAVLHRTMKTV
jgi:hypothetical protein